MIAPRRTAMAESSKKKYSNVGKTSSKRESLCEAILEQECQQALETSVSFIAHPDFNRPNADTLLLKGLTDFKPGAETFEELRNVPLLTKEQEHTLFRAMNYLKHRAAKIQQRLPRARHKEFLLEEMNLSLRQSEEVRNYILRANLRLVISIAKKYVNAANTFDELISEGNLSLLQAVEKFDVSRGNRFSTYATRAIRNNLYHYVFDKHKRRQQVTLAEDELLQTTRDERANETACELRLDYIRRSLARIMKRLDAQKQSIITQRFGLNGEENPPTLKELARDMGVSRERVRQIQVRAMKELLQFANEEKIELPDDDVL
ncbi:sigma-70 family RNA polymerase sigma factor [bacterium]|nr:sigma-70 family RNA polymerase sigma factor [bacterium]